MQHALTQPRGFRLPLVLTYAGAIWLAGFAWGSIVFMIPALKAIAPIPYVSSNPAISFPSLLLWLPLTYWLARRVLRASDAPAVDGLTVGMLFAAGSTRCSTCWCWWYCLTPARRTFSR